MVAKKVVFVCDACGYETFKWMGKCPKCQGWDTIREYKVDKATESQEKKTPVIVTDDDITEERIILGIEEMDRVLGGGLTTGSSILLGGDPGIGKTTLCFEIAARMVELGLNVLYVSGEESLKQLASRRKRLDLKGNFPILATNQLDDILEAASEKAYDLVIIDSIQSVYDSRLPMLPGNVSQIKDVSSKLTIAMKSTDTTLIFIGHVTKEGAIAGPKILEHMVDTVLYFEGDKMLPYRMLRAIKNRYGPVDEVGIFQMKKGGLISVENPSQFFISERGDIGSGSALFPYITGSRPIILEVQAVTPKTNFSIPKRLSLGYDINRLFILIAVIEKALGKPFYDRDVYVNITGGMKVNEPAVDLSVAASIISSFKDIVIGQDTALFGEVGLTGEIRKIVYMDMRFRECERLGIKKIFCPKGVEKVPGLEVIPLKNIRELYEHIT
ncbi:MAG TPA: DNA repair protein RadA [Syntrophorhabdaceae bacterium]|nr:DNA repair protein RadA [Syntrophorhabdaceae bacterium]HQM80558.1 DNA repair protein RadA [Syntrophorhabdaceae bacterium]